MSIIATVLTAIYPLLVYFGLNRFEPQVMAVLLAFAALLRWRGGQKALSGLGWEGYAALAVPMSLAIATGIGNKEITLKLYPVAVNVTLLVTFGATLFSKESMVERIARMRSKDRHLNDEEVLYTRRVTEIWCAFFAVNGAISAWTAMRTSREIWAFYNGFLVYIVIATIFSVEWLCRRRLISKKDREKLEPK
ncbi:MAG: hypothetical protein AABZ15_01885 [Nitrospirota bacterium]